MGRHSAARKKKRIAAGEGWSSASFERRGEAEPSAPRVEERRGGAKSSRGATDTSCSAVTSPSLRTPDRRTAGGPQSVTGAKLRVCASWVGERGRRAHPASRMSTVAFRAKATSTQMKRASGSPHRSKAEPTDCGRDEVQELLRERSTVQAPRQ